MAKDTPQAIRRAQEVIAGLPPVSTAYSRNKAAAAQRRASTTAKQRKKTNRALREATPQGGSGEDGGGGLFGLGVGPDVGFMDALKTLDVPASYARSALFGQVAPEIADQLGVGREHDFSLSQLQKDASQHLVFTDYIDRADDGEINKSAGEGLGWSIGGFAVDAIVDPLVALGPAAKLAGGARQVATRILTEGGERAAIEFAARAGVSTADEIAMRALREEGTRLAEQAAAKVARRGASSLTNEEARLLLGQTGGVKFQVPGTGRVLGPVTGLQSRQLTVVPKGVTRGVTGPTRAAYDAIRGSKVGDVLSKVGGENSRILREALLSGDDARIVRTLRQLDNAATSKARAAAAMHSFANEYNRGSRETGEIALRKALKGREAEVIREIEEGVADLSPEAARLKDFLGRLYQTASDAGVPIQELDDYFPRVITDEVRQARRGLDAGPNYRGAFNPTRARTIDATTERIAGMLPADASNYAIRRAVNQYAAEELGIKGGKFFEENMDKVLGAYIKGLEKRIGRALETRGLIDLGIARNPLQEAMDASMGAQRGAIDEAQNARMAATAAQDRVASQVDIRAELDALTGPRALEAGPPPPRMLGPGSPEYGPAAPTIDEALDAVRVGPEGSWLNRVRKPIYDEDFNLIGFEGDDLSALADNAAGGARQGQEPIRGLTPEEEAARASRRGAQLEERQARDVVRREMLGREAADLERQADEIARQADAAEWGKPTRRKNPNYEPGTTTSKKVRVPDPDNPGKTIRASTGNKFEYTVLGPDGTLYRAPTKAELTQLIERAQQSVEDEVGMLLAQAEWKRGNSRPLAEIYARQAPKSVRRELRDANERDIRRFFEDMGISRDAMKDPAVDARFIKGEAERIDAYVKSLDEQYARQFLTDPLGQQVRADEAARAAGFQREARAGMAEANRIDVGETTLSGAVRSGTDYNAAAGSSSVNIPKYEPRTGWQYSQLGSRRSGASTADAIPIEPFGPNAPPPLASAAVEHARDVDQLAFELQDLVDMQRAYILDDGILISHGGSPTGQSIKMGTWGDRPVPTGYEEPVMPPRAQTRTPRTTAAGSGKGPLKGSPEVIGGTGTRSLPASVSVDRPFLNTLREALDAVGDGPKVQQRELEEAFIALGGNKHELKTYLAMDYYGAGKTAPRGRLDRAHLDEIVNPGAVDRQVADQAPARDVRQGVADARTGELQRYPASMAQDVVSASQQAERVQNALIRIADRADISVDELLTIERNYSTSTFRQAPEVATSSRSELLRQKGLVQDQIDEIDAALKRYEGQLGPSMQRFLDDTAAARERIAEINALENRNPLAGGTFEGRFGISAFDDEQIAAMREERDRLVADVERRRPPGGTPEQALARRRVDDLRRRRDELVSSRDSLLRQAEQAKGAAPPTGGRRLVGDLYKINRQRLAEIGEDMALAEEIAMGSRVAAQAEDIPNALNAGALDATRVGRVAELNVEDELAKAVRELTELEGRAAQRAIGGRVGPQPAIGGRVGPQAELMPPYSQRAIMPRDSRLPNIGGQLVPRADPYAFPPTNAALSAALDAAQGVSPQPALGAREALQALPGPPQRAALGAGTNPYTTMSAADTLGVEMAVDQALNAPVQRAIGGQVGPQPAVGGRVGPQRELMPGPPDMRLAREAQRIGLEQQRVALLQRALQEPDVLAREAALLEAQAKRAESLLLAGGDSSPNWSQLDFHSAKDLPEVQQIVNRLHQEGYDWISGSYGTMAPQDIVDAMAPLTKLQDPAAVADFLNVYDKVVNWIKAWQMATPGFHARNFMGGMFNNWLADIDPGSYRRYMATRRAFERGEGAGYRFLGHKVTEAELDAYRQLDQVFTTHQFGGEELRQGMGHESWQTRANPFSSEFAWLGASKYAGGRVEEILRGSLGMDRLLKGQTVDAALQDIYKFHFDYSDLTDFERQFVKRIVPFYTWTRKNLPLQLEMMATRPGKYAWYYKLDQNLRRNDTEEGGVVPQYFNDLMGMPTGLRVGGSQMYAFPDVPFTKSLTTGLPFTSEQGLSGNPLLSMMTPVIKTPLEVARGQQFYKDIPFTGKKQEAPKAWTSIPGLGVALQAVGVIDKKGRISDEDQYIVEQYLPMLGRMRRLAPSSEKDQARALSSWLAFFGVPLKTNTPYEQKMERLRRQFEGR